MQLHYITSHYIISWYGFTPVIEHRFNEILFLINVMNTLVRDVNASQNKFLHQHFISYQCNCILVLSAVIINIYEIESTFLILYIVVPQKCMWAKLFWGVNLSSVIRERMFHMVYRREHCTKSCNAKGILLLLCMVLANVHSTTCAGTNNWVCPYRLWWLYFHLLQHHRRVESRGPQLRTSCLCAVFKMASAYTIAVSYIRDLLKGKL